MAEFSDINKCKYLILEEYREVGDNELVISLLEAAPSNETETVKIAANVTTQANRVAVPARAKRFVLHFDICVSIQIVNESYATPPTSAELYSGRLAREYTKSKYIDYVRATTIIEAVWPNQIRHYGILTESSCFDVVSLHPVNLETFLVTEPLELCIDHMIERYSEG